MSCTGRHIVMPNCTQLTKTFGSKRPAVDLSLTVVFCSRKNLASVYQRNYEPLQHQVGIYYIDPEFMVINCIKHPITKYLCIKTLLAFYHFSYKSCKIAINPVANG